MSILSDKTEHKAVLETAKVLRLFPRLDFLLICAEDALKLREAENLLKSVVSGNGYTIRFSKKRGTTIIRTKLK